MQAIKFILTIAITTIGLHPSALKAEEQEQDPKEFLGKVLSKDLHHPDSHSIRDLFVEDVPGSESYWLAPWVKTVAVNGVARFYLVEGYNRFYLNAAFLGDAQATFFSRSTGIYDFYGPFDGKPDDHFKIPAKQADSETPAPVLNPKLKRAAKLTLRDDEVLKFTGKVESFIGHSLGYMPPTQGEELQFDASAPNTTMLNFGPAGDGVQNYIPFQGEFEITNLKRFGNTKRTLRSVRMIAEKSGHQVTLNFAQGGGEGLDRMWILIESDGDIAGVWNLTGTLNTIAVKDSGMNDQPSED